MTPALLLLIRPLAKVLILGDFQSCKMGREWLQNSGRRMGDGAKGLRLGRPQLPGSKSAPRKGFSITHQQMRNKSE